MRSDIQHTVKKGTTEKSFVKLINSTAMRAGSLKKSKPKGVSTRILSSNHNAICD